MSTNHNPLGMQGIEFVEFSGPNKQMLHRLFTDFGFSKLKEHRDKDVTYYRQNDIHFLLNAQPGSFARAFADAHGPSISAMGWRVEDARKAFDEAVARGAKQAQSVDYDVPPIEGIGGSLIYFIDRYENGAAYERMGFVDLKEAELVPHKGFLAIDHLTNNVYKGTMEEWANFYKDVFGFTEVRTFDIKGKKTGLQSYALRSPCGTFCIPINEADEAKSQINEYLEEYHGPGVQHLAFVSHDLLNSLKQLEATSVQTLDIGKDYYKSVFSRVPNVSEDHKEIEKREVLVDGDDDGYLLQIFTKNVVGPIFIEMIQRKNHNSFGEGNFQALFDSIERDQERRGYLDN